MAQALVVVSCQTGLRRGNLTKLTVSQVDFTAGRIIVGKAKNGDPIGIEMTSIVKKTLLEVIGSRKVTSPYVFCDEKGKRYPPNQVMKRILAVAIILAIAVTVASRD